MSSRLLSLKLVSSMVDRKLDDTEIGAILEAFSESREAKARLTNQSTTFKLLLAFGNIYVLGFSIIYILLKNNLLQPLDANLITEDFLTVFDGRANIMFWLLVLINMGAYFNIGFKIMCLISIIYILNATADNFVVARLMGHEIEGQTFGNYSDGLALKGLREAINHLNWSSHDK